MLIAVLSLFPKMPGCIFQKSILPAVSGRATNGDPKFSTLLRPLQQCNQPVGKIAFKTEKRQAGLWESKNMYLTGKQISSEV